MGEPRYGYVQHWEELGFYPLFMIMQPKTYGYSILPVPTPTLNPIADASIYRDPMDHERLSCLASSSSSIRRIVPSPLEEGIS